MLIEFRVKNFRSFNEEQVFSLVASKDDRLSGLVRDKGDWRLLPSAVVYGPNASGKSNLIKAVRTMSNFVRLSSEQVSTARRGLIPFALDESSLSSPSSFEATFLIEGVRYQYGFSATQERVWSEWLLSYPKGRAQTWIQRDYHRERDETQWRLGRALLGDKEQLKAKVRPDALFLSVAAQWNQEQLQPVYDYLSSKLRTVLPHTRDIAQVSERMLASAQWKEVMLSLLRHVDPTIWDVVSENVTPAQLGLPDILPDKDREQLRLHYRKNPRFTALFQHGSETTGQKAQIPFDQESDGTRRFFQLLGPWIVTLTQGHTVFIDELEKSLHPLLARALVEIPYSRHFREGAAQLVFTTHDTTLLDPELFRRDQIWFTEKSNDGATHLYSLSDYKTHRARKDESFQKNYLAGRYGAIPIIEAFELNEIEKSEA